MAVLICYARQLNRGTSIMIINMSRWILHWLGQGLKLWLFAVLASVCVLPIYLPLGLLEDAACYFDEFTLLGKSVVLAGRIVCYAIAIAVFTAVLASQLKDHPLRAFISKKDDKTKKSEGAVVDSSMEVYRPTFHDD